VFRYITSVSLYIETVYFLFFAVFIIGVEFGIKYFKQLFFFLNFLWGKALFNLFLGCLGITSGKALDIGISIYFFVIACLEFFLFFIYKAEERGLISIEKSNVIS
jgi:hypothetical protein